MKNRDKINAQKREAYYKNQEENIKKAKEYYLQNKKQISAKNKERYKLSKKEICQKRKEYYRNNKEKCSERAKKYRAENAEILKIKKKEYSDRKTAERRAIREANKEVLPENHKRCTKCKEAKSFDNFQKSIRSLFGFRSICKICDRKQGKKWYQENKDLINQKRREYNKNNIEKIRKRKRKWSTSEKGRKCKNNYYHSVEKHDIQKRLAMNLRGRICEALKKQKITKKHKSLKLVGCDIKFLKNHLEKQFTNGMNWNNYGDEIGNWCIDHIIPINSVDLTIEESQFKIFNWTNLRPLWFRDNCIKAAEDKKLSIKNKINSETLTNREISWK